MAKATGSSGLLVSFMVGATGVVLVLSAVRGATPGKTLQSLLQNGQLPYPRAGYDKSVPLNKAHDPKAKTTVIGKPGQTKMYSQPIGPGLPGSP